MRKRYVIFSADLEASDGVGGRVRTDAVDGFLLDRGFQILLTAYPEVQNRLDLDALELCLFEPGAVIRVRGGFHRVSHPLRRPRQIPQGEDGRDRNPGRRASRPEGHT